MLLPPLLRLMLNDTFVYDLLGPPIVTCLASYGFEADTNDDVLLILFFVPYPSSRVVTLTSLFRRSVSVTSWSSSGRA